MEIVLIPLQHTKTECDFFYGWIKKTVTYAKIAPKMVNPRDLAGIAEEEEECCVSLVSTRKEAR